jgi:hypothetical protein
MKVTSPPKPSDFKWQGQVKFECFGAKIGVRFNDINARDAVLAALPSMAKTLNQKAPVTHTFFLAWEAKGKQDALFKDDELIAIRRDKDRLLALLETQIRMLIGETAPEHVFIHAGAVMLNGKALIIPAKSYSGKTTLVAELVKNGAVYYSDEYAVIDRNGFLHPYAKKLSLRKPGKYKQTDVSVENLGGRQGTELARVDCVLLVTFDAKLPPGYRPRFRKLSPGKGIMEILKHALPIRSNPKLTLLALNNLTKGAIIYATKRGEVTDFVKFILNLLS